MARSIYRHRDNAWREGYNPLRGLTLTGLQSLISAGDAGRYADLQWLYQHVEKSDSMVFSVLQRRRAAFSDCDWDIRTVAGSDEALAAEQAACLREVYEGIKNFREAMGFLFTAVFRGYAHLEQHYDAAGGVTRLEPVEQWFWVRDGMFGEWEYNENAVSGRNRGKPIRRDDFVIAECSAVDRILSGLYVQRALAIGDEASYLEVFGISSTFIVGPPNVPADKEAEFQATAEAIASNSRGYLPHGSDV